MLRKLAGNLFILVLKVIEESSSVVLRSTEVPKYVVVNCWLLDLVKTKTYYSIEISVKKM